MNPEQAIAGFGALAQPHRLAVFRLLVRRGPEGMRAGDIAAAVGVSPSNLSFHVACLERAGLLAARREGQSVLYTVDVARTRKLVDFLTEDCCGGRPEICGYAAADRQEKAPRAARRARP